MTENPFLEFLRRGEEVGFQTDDLLAAVLPVFRQVATWHESGFVAPIEALASLSVTENALTCTGTPTPPTANLAVVEALQKPVASALHIVGRTRLISDEEGDAQISNLEVSDGEGELTQPAYVVGYRSWEGMLGHHDAATDIFNLGQILASLALGLDFTDLDDLSRFAAHRTNLFSINPRLHPVLAAVIVEMTDLNRHKRSPDLASLVCQLEDYREQKVDLNVSQLPGFAASGLPDRRRLIQSHLRDRLFDISRRNRLIYYRPSQASLNFTVASVPLVMNLASVRLEQLFVWHPALASEVIEGKPMNLGRWLRFEDQPYLPSALDKMIADARRDRAEFGCAQLRLVIAFLHWHNLKEAPQERVVSPLLLLPVELSKKKGVRDQYILDPTSTEAEVNPALRHHLNQLYGLALPESIDLSNCPLEQFHQDLQTRIQATEPAVTLRLIEKPEIQLIHERARQRLAQFQRKQKLRLTTHRPKASYSYSYDSENFRPLGLQLFREKVEPAALPQRAAAGGLHAARTPHMVAAANPILETERQTFTLREDRPGNPYAWDFDLCSMTVGNFNYRKMSLVRDYGSLLTNGFASEAFDSVFSLEPRKADDESPGRLPRADQWPVVPGDATQTAAIALARTGRSYIIQGPPGTGKSQTITNLIADQVACNRRVLFVCEKRAAIDVVFHRLRQQGLDELCTLIHDSQADKKAFVLNLKQTYEKWLQEPDGADQIRQEREALLAQMEQDLESLRRFDSVMQSVPPEIAIPLRELLHRLIELRECAPTLTPEEYERLPNYALWRQHATLARRLASTLDEVSDCSALAQHPFRWLGKGIITSERPLELLNKYCSEAEAALDEIETALGASSLEENHWDSFDKVRQLAVFASQVSELAERDQLGLLNPKSQAAGQLNKTVGELESRAKRLAQARERTVNWRDRLPEADLAPAIAQASATEDSLLRWIKPSWWQLRKVLDSRYDFSKHAIRPKYSQVLSDLEADYAAARASEEALQTAADEYHTEPIALHASLKQWQIADSTQPAVTALRELLLRDPNAREIVSRLSALSPRLAELVPVLDTLIYGYEHSSLPTLGEAVRDLREESDALPDLLPLLTELAELPASLSQTLRHMNLSPDQFEAAIARADLEKIYRSERWLPRFDGRLLAYRAERIASSERSWLEKNAGLLRAEVRRRFRANVQTSSVSVTQLDTDRRAFKKSYSAGRRELEHEFGKSMRYKSIRDLAAGDSGRVIRDLKPIWLMSPLSVSDTLPLATDLFDVVIFDEASQIPVEEAVPAIYRAPQVIVVGDEMQLPPTSFFSASSDSDEEILEAEEGGERVAVSLDADSFLTQSAKNLPATLLAWHYRSRSESLIGFSNAAFYAGNLFTIPDRTLPQVDQKPIEVNLPEDAATHCEALLTRPISFHLMSKSPYENRRNAGEAAYIACLIREILQKQTGFSVGVVAFSEAQQSEIESALDALAGEDAGFAARLEEEYVREENDQFCGLFVKNLENVQGDERDIILLSICYGPDTQGRMVMNFGPINQRGGEKRLNVIFSRARLHMAVISSIHHAAITNDYNDGASALKNFLHYAESASRGDRQMTRTILEGLNPLARKQLAVNTETDAVTAQLANALEKRGFKTELHVGQSRFRCDLAVRTNSSREYLAGILIDTSHRSVVSPTDERYVTQPEILRAFGWRVAIVLTRDWYHDPQLVLERIERLLRGESETPPPFDEIAAVQAVVEESPKLDPSPELRSVTADGGAIVSRLEFVEGKSAKFWEAKVENETIVLRYGRLGTQGQMLTKTFETPERAEREMNKLKAEKLRKGYIEKS